LTPGTGRESLVRIGIDNSSIETLDDRVYAAFLQIAPHCRVQPSIPFKALKTFFLSLKQGINPPAIRTATTVYRTYLSTDVVKWEEWVDVWSSLTALLSVDIAHSSELADIIQLVILAADPNMFANNAKKVSQIVITVDPRWPAAYLPHSPPLLPCTTTKQTCALHLNQRSITTLIHHGCPQPRPS
jgi:hypothetical protein